jgi:hypothetical protein
VEEGRRVIKDGKERSGVCMDYKRPLDLTPHNLDNRAQGEKGILIDKDPGHLPDLRKGG